MIRRLLYLSTVAGLAGLVVLHADDFGRLLNAAVGTFRKGVTLGG